MKVIKESLFIINFILIALLMGCASPQVDILMADEIVGEVYGANIIKGKSSSFTENSLYVGDGKRKFHLGGETMPISPTDPFFLSTHRTLKKQSINHGIHCKFFVGYLFSSNIDDKNGTYGIAVQNHTSNELELLLVIDKFGLGDYQLDYDTKTEIASFKYYFDVFISNKYIMTEDDNYVFNEKKITFFLVKIENKESFERLTSISIYYDTKDEQIIVTK